MQKGEVPKRHEPFDVFFFIRCQGGENSIVCLLKELRRDPKVKEATPLTGNYDVIMKVSVKDELEFARFHTYVDQLPHVARSEAYVVATTLDQKARI